MEKNSGNHGRDFLFTAVTPATFPVNIWKTIFGETGVPVVNVYNACATGSAAIRMAYNSVAAGETDTALAFGADVSPKGFLTAKSDNAVSGQGRDQMENDRYAQSGLLGAGMHQKDGKIRHHRRGFGNGQGPVE